MIRATLNDKGLVEVVCDTALEARSVAEINCAARIRGKPLQYTLPVAFNSTTELARRHAELSPELQRLAQKLETIDRYVLHIKNQEHVEPLQPVPIKAPYTLFQHQVKAFNIALALFGRGAKKRGDVQ